MYGGPKKPPSFKMKIKERLIRLEESQRNQKEAIASTLAAADKAILKAETAFEKRLDGVNEFRATLSDQQRNLMPRAECELKFNDIDKSLDQIRNNLSNKYGQKTGGQEVWGYVVGAAGLIALIVSFFK